MAKKDKFHPIQMILTGILWSAFYFGFVMPVLGWVFNFDFLSMDAWQRKYQDFIHYKWNVNTLFDTLLFFSMILWIPVWGLGWRYIYKRDWQKLKPKPRRKAIMKKTFELRENKQVYPMPRKMPSVVQVSHYVAPKLPNQSEEVVSGTKSHTNLIQMIRLIATLAKKYKVEIFQHILLEGNRVPMAISTDTRAVLIEIVNKKNVNWSVEFTDDVTQGNWYSEGGVMEKLAQDLVRAGVSLAKSEPNSEILSAIVVTDGRVLNTKQAVAYFKSKGIFLIGYNKAEPKTELPDLASFLSTYFDLKEGETDPAPHPVQKVPLKAKQAVSTNTVETTDTETEIQSDDMSETEELSPEEAETAEETDDSDEIIETEEKEATVFDEADEADETVEETDDETDDEALEETAEVFAVNEETDLETDLTETEVQSVDVVKPSAVRKIRAPMPAARESKIQKPTEES